LLQRLLSIPIPSGGNINAQCFYYQSGLPRAVLYNNNTLTFRTVPDQQYLVEIDAYLSPSAFLNADNAFHFGYMAEYIARGAARKILSDTGDVDQLQFYEPLFREQEMLVWKRSQRQFTSTRTQTIYSQGTAQVKLDYNNFGGTSFRRIMTFTYTRNRPNPPNNPSSDVPDMLTEHKFY